MKDRYQKTMTACFVAYIVQAIVNNFVPLLFLTFQRSYQLPLDRITLLVTLNFGIQLLVDLLSVSFVDRIGYRASMVLAHAFAAAGLILLTILPEVMPDICTICRMVVFLYPWLRKSFSAVVRIFSRTPCMCTALFSDFAIYTSLFYCYGFIVALVCENSLSK